MKISILTATYNRANLLTKLYNSLIENMNYGLEIEWLIMDDGSQDNTKQVVEKFAEENKIQIKYNYQENQGKMVAINNLVEQATGDLIVDCDSDDYFTNDAFKIIKEEFEKKEENLYAKCFLKKGNNDKIDGTEAKKEITTMFDLYFRDGVTGEKSLVYYADIRKKFRHEIEQNEKFVTEDRMHHKMDEKYKIKCVNKVIQQCEYKRDGYTSNISNTFFSSPRGYLEYFRGIMKKDFKGVIWKKRLYAIKHYILFSTITNERVDLKQVKDNLNKILLIALFVPGRIKSLVFFKQKSN